MAMARSGPERLEDQARRGRLIAFVGAGVSVAPPTCLPSWWEVNQAVVEALARQVDPAVRDRARAAAALVSARQRADRFPPEYQAEIIVGRLRQRYFEVLRCLDGDEPNGSHLALAALARAGHVRAIITTNFDRVLEAAFVRAGAPLDVLYRPEHFAALAADTSLLDRDGGPCRLLKIHGSADAPDTLVDTLSQRKRGLSPETQACIRHLLRFGHWMFLGFSGADLEADAGYLHLRGDRDVAAGFTWLVRNGEKPLDAVQRLVALYGTKGGTVHGELPAWLEALARRLIGGAQPEPAALSRKQVEARRSEASARVLEHTDAWATELGERRCAVVLAALVAAVAEPGEALALLSAAREVVSHADRATGTYGLMCDELGSLHRGRGENEVAVERFDEAVRVFEALAAEEQAIGVRSNMALALTDQGRYDEALEHFGAARAWAADDGRREEESVALHNIALVHSARGEFARAIALYEEELEQVTALGAERARATVLLCIGEALARLDRHDEALERLNAAVGILERLGDDAGLARALGNLATVHHGRARYDEAVRLYAESSSLFERLGDTDGEITTQLNLASIEQARGRPAEALRLAERAGNRASAAGLTPLHARALHVVGAMYEDLHAPGRAAIALEKALALRTASGDRRGRAESLNELGIVWRTLNEPRRAREALDEALRIRTELGLGAERSATLNNLAMLAQDRGDLPEAERLLTESIGTLDRAGLAARTAPAAFNLANTYLAMDRLDEAATWFERALAANERSGHAGRATDARVALAWTRGLQGRPDEARAAFAAAEAEAPSPEALLLVAARMTELAELYRTSGHEDIAVSMGAEARRIDAAAARARMG